MNTAEQNYRLIREIEASRMFLLMACQQNPDLLERADARIRQMLVKSMPQNHSIPLHMPLGEVGKQHGISLIELLTFIIILSIAVTGVLLVMNKVGSNSAETLLRKQSLAVAESVLEEIELQDFISVSGVTNAVTLVNRTTEYHIVADYNGFASAGVFSASTGVGIPRLGAYAVAVAVAPTALGGIPAASSVLVTVTVTDPRGFPNRIQLSGYRTAY